MDYEKKYKEALEKAKFYYDNWPLEDEKNKLENMFPELRESEDERIRKDIVAAVEMRGDLTQVRKSEIYAYLEKQEQKQTDLPAGFYYIDLNGNRYYSKEFRYGDMKLKVGEQNPAWSEVDSVTLDCAVEVVERAGLPSLAASLKSLRPPHKQEWSEEDERILKGIIGKIDHDQTYGVSKDEMLNFLKRL